MKISMISDVREFDPMLVDHSEVTNDFAAQLVNDLELVVDGDRPEFEENTVIGAKTEDVLRYIRPVVRQAQPADMHRSGIAPPAGHLKKGAAYLALGIM